jgi:hypothetical protein
MRRLIWLAGLGLLAVELSRCVFEMAGSPSVRPSKGDDELRTGVDLRKEFPASKVPNSVINIFDSAAMLQNGGKFVEAEREYNRISRIRQPDGSVLNLSTDSASYRANMRLLEKKRLNPSSIIP